MQRQPRSRLESIASPSFLRTLFFTGALTTLVTFGVYYYILRTQTPEQARTYAFTVLVIAELLRAFGARSATKPLWRISLWTNTNLLVVVLISFGLQWWSLHHALLGQFLRTTFIPLEDCLLLLALAFGVVILLLLPNRCLCTLPFLTP